MDLMKGKKGLIMGVANERSIAWGISQKLTEAGAELAFTYPADALKKRVIPLAEKLNSKVTFSCDVEKKEDVTKLFEDVKSQWGEIDFVVHAIAFSDKSELSGEYLNTTIENFLISIRQNFQHHEYQHFFSKKSDPHSIYIKILRLQSQMRLRFLLVPHL